MKPGSTTREYCLWPEFNHFNWVYENVHYLDLIFQADNINLKIHDLRQFGNTKMKVKFNHFQLQSLCIQNIPKYLAFKNPFTQNITVSAVTLPPCRRFNNFTT